MRWWCGTARARSGIPPTASAITVITTISFSECILRRGKAGGMENLYLHKNGAGNNDTRILRFKKSDVEYIY